MVLNSKIEKALSFFLLLLFIAFMLYIGKTQRDRHNSLKNTVADQQYLISMVNQRTRVLEQLVRDKKKGRRKDPFRCSDAKKYFNQIEITVDCERIEDEVNGGAAE